MRFVRLFIISAVVLFIVVLFISLLFPSKVRVSRAANFKASREELMSFVGDPAQWMKWYPGLDSATVVMQNGNATGVILTDQPRRAIMLTKKTTNEVQAEYINPQLKPVINGWNIISEPGADSVTLQWYMEFRLRWYPWEKFGSMVLEKSNGARMEEGLKKLKSITEGQ